MSTTSGNARRVLERCRHCGALPRRLARRRVPLDSTARHASQVVPEASELAVTDGAGHQPSCGQLSAALLARSQAQLRHGPGAEYSYACCVAGEFS